MMGRGTAWGAGLEREGKTRVFVDVERLFSFLVGPREHVTVWVLGRDVHYKSPDLQPTPGGGLASLFGFLNVYSFLKRKGRASPPLRSKKLRIY